MRRGRFAPSPTGPLHFGSLVTAVASFLDASPGEWLVRMEDVDTTRTAPGAASAILRSLEAHGLEWSGSVAIQSERTDRYKEAFRKLPVYPCGCSRRENATGPYPGTCRNGLAPGRSARAWRIRVPSVPIHFEDRILGRFAENLEQTCGDFVLLRADGLFAYQLAVVVDDIDQGITHVVRGRDLLDSTARQVFLYRLLNAAVPGYLHIPLALNSKGEKLSKQTNAPPLDDTRPGENIWNALKFLKLDPPKELKNPSVLLNWARENWSFT